jgi:hypothetical protein
MKNFLLFSIITFKYIISFSQNSEPYHTLFDSCQEKEGKCWKIDLCWDEELQDFSTVGGSDILFTYFPENNQNCLTNTSYRLKPITSDAQIVTWQYKDDKIYIRVRMQMVETIFGFQLYDVTATNTIIDSCQPKNIVWSY